MYKLSKVVLIFDLDIGNEQLYLRALESSEYITVFANNEDDFIEKCKESVPNVIVLNGTQEDLPYQKIIKNIRKSPLLRNSGLLLLVDKLNHANTYKGEKLKIDIEEFPLQNHHFLQRIKKLATKLVLPEIKFENLPEVEGTTHVEFSEFNKIECQFFSPIKMQQGLEMNLTGDLLLKLGIHQDRFIAAHTGASVEGKGYLNRVDLTGLSFENLKTINDYKNGKVI